MHKNKYIKYSSKLQKLNGGLLCHPKIDKSIISNIEDTYKFEGNHSIGFRKTINKKNYLIKPFINSLGEKKLLGQGGMGKVYLGRLLYNYENHVSNSNVVIKEQIMDNDEYKYFICSELATVIFTNHPNIVKYYGYAELDQSHTRNNIICIFMEYIHGKELYDCITENLLTKKNKIQIAKQLIDGLIYLHQNKIFHRDIKLENIMVQDIGTDNVKIKYLDFGFSCKQSVSCESSVYDQGTVNYISPDFAKNINLKNFDLNLYEYYDLWALGVVLFALFAGRMLMLFENNSGSLQKIEKITQNLIDENINKYIKPLILPPPIMENIISLLRVDYNQRTIIPIENDIPVSPLNQNSLLEKTQKSDPSIFRSPTQIFSN